MKKFLFHALSAMLLTSCSSISYIQIVDVQSTLPYKNNNYVYDDGACQITYDLWNAGGSPGFYIKNLTDQTLFLDLSNSYFIKNGAAYDYYLNRTFGSSSTRSHGKTKALSAARYGIWALSRLPGSQSLTISEVAESASSSSVTIEEQKIVSIPPHTFKHVSEYNISNDLIEDCSIRLFPKKHSPEKMTYTKESSPLQFANYITYRVGDGEPKVVETEFYISGYTNYRKKEVMDKVKLGCKSQIERESNKYAAANNYYITYGESHNNDYSADAKKPIK